MFRQMVFWSVAVAAIVAFSDRPVDAGKPAPPSEPITTHTVRWLGNGARVIESYAYGMNMHGDVVGYASWRTDDGGWIGEAFICQAVSLTSPIVNLNSILPVPQHTFLYAAYDINDSGQIIGDLAWNGGKTYAFRYTPATSNLEILGTFGVEPDLSVDRYTRINADGDMLVYSQQYGTACIYTYSPSSPPELQPIQRPDGLRMAFRDMNDFGQVAGHYPGGLFGPFTPVLFTPPDTFTTFGWLRNPGNSPSGKAQGVNNIGVVTGYMPTSGGKVFHAFRFSSENSKLEDLGALGGGSTYGTSINGAGYVVGDASTSSGNTAFYFDTRGMFDLKKSTSGLPADQLQSGMTARRIDNGGAILGKIGSYACVLQPVTK